MNSQSNEITPTHHDSPTVRRGEPGGNEPVLVISCDTCVMANTSACDDCMMSVLCEPRETGAVVLSLSELRDIRLLAQAGLVPTLRHRAVG
jgi:hypothetical protein